IPDTLITANATLGQAIQELRSLSKSMDREWLEQFSFDENLVAEINRIHSTNVINARYINEGDLPLKSDNQIILFRIVQESIQNAIKHAKPKNILVSIERSNTFINISIRDDGSGFMPGNEVNGMGVNNMKHRTKILGGTIKWQSESQLGTTVLITLPVNPELL
ncbi:MAG: ATP-binding protein, partial [Ferruginibacter sp.]